jgi:hypothetical protein
VPELRAAVVAYLGIRDAIYTALGMSPAEPEQRGANDQRRQQSRRA